MNYTCPVCGYNRLEQPPERYFICPSCGTEFGLDDRVATHAQLRREWLLSGAPWFDYGTPQPLNWNPYIQLLNAGLGYSIATKEANVNFAFVGDPYRAIARDNEPSVFVCAVA